MASNSVASGARLVASGDIRVGVPVSGMRKAAGSAALVLVDGAMPLRPEPALFEAMLEGWRRQQAARRLSVPLIDGRVRLVRRFADFTGAWPWQWEPAQVEAWISSGGWAHSTVRSYEGALAVFLDYACDVRYGWAAECEQRVGAGLPGSAMRATPPCMPRSMSGLPRVFRTVELMLFMLRAAGSGTRRGLLAESYSRVLSGDVSYCTGARCTAQCLRLLFSLSGKQCGTPARL